jgi:hypothetical protein
MTDIKKNLGKMIGLEPNQSIALCRLGEDPALVFGLDRPIPEGGVAIVNVWGLPPRPEYCTRGSVAAGLNAARGTIGALFNGCSPKSERHKRARRMLNEWLALCEGVGIGFGYRIADPYPDY